MIFPSFNRCILASALLLPVVSAQAGVPEGLSQYYRPSEWLAKVIDMVPTPCNSSENLLCIPSRDISESQRSASAIWQALSPTDAAQAISSSYHRARSLLSARLKTQTTKAIVITKNGLDWGSVEETEVKLADGTRAFCWATLGNRGVYCSDVEIRGDPNGPQSLYGKTIAVDSDESHSRSILVILMLVLGLLGVPIMGVQVFMGWVSVASIKAWVITWMAGRENTPVPGKEQDQFDDETFIEYVSDSECYTEYGSDYDYDYDYDYDDDDDEEEDEAGDMFYMYIVDDSDDEITTDDEEMFEPESGNLSGDEVEMDGFLGVEVQ